MIKREIKLILLDPKLLQVLKDFTFNNVLNVSYKKSFGDHSLDVGAYLEYIKAHYHGKDKSRPD